MGEAAVIDLSTGQIINHANEGDRIKVIRKESLDYLKETVSINSDEPFVKVYTTVLFKLSRSLSGTESQFINYLLQYIRYTSGLLEYRNGNTLTRSHMALETGLNIKTIDRLLKSLVDKQVLGKHKTGQDISFTVNPFIFMKGKRISDTLFNLFKNTKWATK